MTDSIEAVFAELNTPSAPRLKRVLRARNIQFDANDVDRIVRGKRRAKYKHLGTCLMAN